MAIAHWGGLKLTVKVIGQVRRLAKMAKRSVWPRSSIDGSFSSYKFTAVSASKMTSLSALFDSPRCNRDRISTFYKSSKPVGRWRPDSNWSFERLACGTVRRHVRTVSGTTGAYWCGFAEECLDAPCRGPAAKHPTSRKTFHCSVDYVSVSVIATPTSSRKHDRTEYSANQPRAKTEGSWVLMQDSQSTDNFYAPSQIEGIDKPCCDPSVCLTVCPFHAPA